jgi:hypothetical protein
MPLHGTFATCPDETCWDVQFDRFGVKAGRRLALGRQVFMFSPAGRSAGRPGRSLCGLPIDMAAAQRDDIVDGARAALVRLDMIAVMPGRMSVVTESTKSESRASITTSPLSPVVAPSAAPSAIPGAPPISPISAPVTVPTTVPSK